MWRDDWLDLVAIACAVVVALLLIALACWLFGREMVPLELP